MTKYDGVLVRDPLPETIVPGPLLCAILASQET